MRKAKEILKEMQKSALEGRVKQLAMTSIENPPSTPTPMKLSPQECVDCGGAGYLREDVPVGHPRFGKFKECDNAIHDPEKMRRFCEISGLPAEFLKLSLGDFSMNQGNKKMLEAARSMAVDPYGFLYVWGGPGNAKSAVLISLVNHFNRAGRVAVYTKFSKIVEHMRDSFRQKKIRDKDPFADDSYIKRFNRLVNIPVLAIDEMDKLRETEFMQEFRFDFLDDRYQQAIAGHTITLMAGNLDPSSFPDMIWDRIRDGRFKVVENTAGSSRPEMRRENAL